MDTSRGDNHKLKGELDSARRSDKENLHRQAGASTNPENAQIEKQIRDNKAKLGAIEQETRQEYALKEKAIARFTDQEANYNRSLIPSNERTLREVEREGTNLGEKYVQLSGEHDKEVAENLKLKALTFDLEYKVNQYQLLVDQSNKKLKFFVDKQSRLGRDLEQAAAN